MAGKLLYQGTSMNPLMREGDVLQIIPYQGLEILRGDVVAFLHPEKPGRVIHRVVAVGPRGIITKGDNTPAVDDWILQPGDILGKVVAIHRQGRTLPVPRAARAGLYFLKVRQWCDQAVSRLLKPLYHRLAQSGLFRGPLAAWMKPRLLFFPRAQGPEWQLWLGGLLIGRKLPHHHHWSIRRPFRLFVDETSLPNQPAEFPEPPP